MTGYIDDLLAGYFDGAGRARFDPDGDMRKEPEPANSAWLRGFQLGLIAAQLAEDRSAERNTDGGTRSR